MGFCEDQIRELDRRIQRIKDNPDPRRMKSNVLLYELERDYRIFMLENWKTKPFIECVMMWTLPRSMGFEFVDLPMAADRMAGDTVEGHFERVRAMGYPDFACDRTVTLLPMVLDGNDLPRPSMLVSLWCGCELVPFSYNALSRELGIPHFCLETRPEPTEQETLRYLTEQLVEFIEFAERKVPGIKYDEEKLLALQDIEKGWYQAYHDLYELRKNVPCPLGGRDAFREPRFPSLYHDPKRAVEYAKAYRDEVFERAAKGLTPVREEKLRFMWMVSGPFYYDPFRFLEDHGVSIPFWMFGEGSRSWGAIYGSWGDVVEYGRKLSPLEDQARLISCNSWGGLGQRWVDDCLFIARDLKIDAIVWYQQLSCTTVSGLEKLLADEAEKELGIPVLFIEGRQSYQAGFNQQEMESKLEVFIQMCLDRKGIK